MLIINSGGGFYQPSISPRAIHLIRHESGQAGKLFSPHSHTPRLPLILILFLLALSIPTAEARNLVSKTIDYAQYGEFLGGLGYGNVLWNFSYDDGTYILKAELRPQLLPGNLYGDGSPADIKFSTSTRGYSSKYTYVIMRCDSELYYQHGEVTRQSYGCGDEMIRDYEFTEERYNIFKNNLVQRQMTQNFQPDVDRIFVNGAQWVPAQRGTATTTSEPAGATVSDANGVLGVTPHTASKPAGTHEITVSKEGYKSLTKSITFTDGIYGSAGSSVSEHFILEIIPPTTGTVTISTTPSGADLYLDGTNIGTSPQTITRAGAVYTVRAVKTGYKEETQAITIANGITTSATITLTAIPATPPPATTTAPPAGTPVITTIPSQTTQPPADTYIEEPCPAGTYLDDDSNTCVQSKNKYTIYYGAALLIVIAFFIIYSNANSNAKKRR